MTDYVWDYRNRLVSVTQRASVGGAATKSVSYGYDVLDRMVSRTVDPDGAGPQAATTRYNVYDGQNQVLELTSTGSVQHRFLYGPAVDQILAQEDSANNVRWMLADEQGTIRDVASYNSGTDQTTVVDHLKYDAFGTLLSQTNPAEQPVFTYTGRFWDADAGLYYYRARWYDARVGRFLSDDPKGFAAGDPNLQRYVLNSPVNYTDPSGMDTCGCSTAFVRYPLGPPKKIKSGSSDDGGPPYFDFNASGGCIVGITGGVQSYGPNENHPYLGGGGTTPGASVSGMVGTGGITPGWQLAGQGQIPGIGFSIGYAFGEGGGWFIEAGPAIASPGVSGYLYYVW